MKKLLFVSIFSLFSMLLAGQNMGKWILPTSTAGSTSNFIPKELNFSNLSLTDNYVQYGYNIPCVAVCGGYAPNYDRRFIIHETYMSWTSSNYIQWSGSTNSFSPELQVIQKFGSQNDHYIFYGCKHCYWADVEMDFFGYRLLSQNSSGWSNSEPTALNAGGVSNPNRSMGFAITDNANSTRKIYLVSHFKAMNSQINGCVERWDMNSQGPDLTSRTSLLNAGYPYLTLTVEDFFAYNVEVKTDNNGNDILAWIVSDNTKSKYLYVYNVNAEELNKFDLGQGRIAGIEFAPGNNSWIYVSATNATGILKVDYTTGNILGTLSGSQNYKRTFLQTAPDGNIYACSNDGGNLGRIVNSTGAFQANSVSFGNKFLDTYVLFGSEKYYLLPEDHSPYVPPLTATFTSTFTAPCQNTGTATVTATGGTAPYTYQWTPAVTNPAGQPNVAINLAYGTYQCTVTDAYGYTATVTINITYDPNVIVTGLNYIANGTHTNETKIFEQGFIVQAGSTVTLNNCNYQFMPGAKVIVEQGSAPGVTPVISGGLLTLNGTTFSSVTACNTRWQGIEVWGNKTAHQYMANGKYAQGRVAANNATIKDAVCAVALWKPGDISKTGGYIIANGTQFLNNVKSIHGYDYENYMPTSPDIKVDNATSITNCTFMMNSQYLPGLLFYKHVDLYKVRGIKINGCDFTVPAGPHPDKATYNSAIECWNAGVKIDAPCTNGNVPCNSFDYCNFSNFHRGVLANATGSNTYTFSIVRANFTNNAIGVYVNGVKNESILFNNFYLGLNYGDDCADGSTSYGIYLENSAGFLIEENTFEKATGAPTGTYMGIAANNCPCNQDVIYKNTFTGLSVGNYTYGINRSNAGLDGTGLSYQCNLNSNNAVDFRVTGAHPDQAKIHGHIGSTTLASGNTFSSTASASWHFRNEGGEDIRYYHFGYASQYPTKIFTIDMNNPDNYFLRLPAPQNTCPSHYGTGGGTGDDDLLVLDPVEKETVAAGYSLADSSYNDVKGLYDYLKDGGNTTGTKQEIETAQPNQMWQLVADLLAKSPYLSEEVLRTAADQTAVIPEAELFDVLAANPDELRNNSLMDYLEQKENPLPGYMIDLLKQVAQGSSAKTVLIEQMDEFNTQRVQAAQKLLCSALNDTVVDRPYIRQWLTKLNSPVADEQVAFAYLEEGKTDSAYLVLDAIPGKYGLDGDALTDFNEFAEMFTFQVQLEQAGRTIFDLDSTELALLEYYANNSMGKAGSMARGILEYTSNGHFCHCPGSQPTWFKQSKPFSKTFADRGIKVTVKPNPADTWAAFDYELPLGITEATLSLTDAQGKLIQTIDLKQNKGQWIWDTRLAGSGAYYYRLQAGSQQAAGKIIVK